MFGIVRRQHTDCVLLEYDGYMRMLDVSLAWRQTLFGGEDGIRTHGTVTRTTVFETVLFNHSSTSPN